MTSARSGRRVVLGIGGGAAFDFPLTVAVAIARSTGGSLNCLVVEREDLLAAAGLPFLRITSSGGISSPVTPELMALHLRRSSRAAESELAARCEAVGVTWSIEHQQGTYVSQLLTAVGEGDVVILEREPGPASNAGVDTLAGELIRKVAAVVLPGNTRLERGSVTVVAPTENDPAVALAQGIASTLALSCRSVSSQDFSLGTARSGIVIVPASLAEELGGVAMIKRQIGRSSTLILVNDMLRESERRHP